MTQDAWPSPDAPSGPLPRIEDLPIAEQGYEQEAVRLAFDSFYRHAAQLDASLRALEAVEVFRRDADALRNDLRALRELGLSGSPDPAWPTLRYEEPRREAPMVVIRLAFEAALIIAVAVVAAVAHFRPVVVVGVMAAAFVIVAFSEWLGARSRFVSPAAGFAPAVGQGEPEAAPAPPVEAAAPVWPAPPPRPEPAREPEALTIVGSADDLREPEAAQVDEPELAAPSEAAEEEQEPAAVEEEQAPVAEEEQEAEMEAPEPVASASEHAEEEPAPGEQTEERPALAEAEAEPAEAVAAEDEDEEPLAGEDDEEAPFDPWEQHLAGDGADEEEPALVERGGFFRRRRR